MPLLGNYYPNQAPCYLQQSFINLPGTCTKILSLTFFQVKKNSSLQITPVGLINLYQTSLKQAESNSCDTAVSYKEMYHSGWEQRSLKVHCLGLKPCSSLTFTRIDLFSLHFSHFLFKFNHVIYILC